MPIMPPAAPQMMPPAMPPQMPMASQDMGMAPQSTDDAQTCPCCGRPMPMPFNSAQAPNAPMPPGVFDEEGGGGGDDSGISALLQAILGGAGGQQVGRSNGGSSSGYGGGLSS